MELLQQKYDIEPGVSGRRGTMNVDKTKRSVSVSANSKILLLQNTDLLILY